MKSWQIMLLVPLFTITFVARGIWTVVLSLLAGMGMASAKEDSKAAPAKSEPDMMVTCYDMAAPVSNFTDPRWMDVAELESWAAAERDIIAAIRNGVEKYQVLQAKIDLAGEKAAAAASAVDKKLLKKESYDIVVQSLQVWHRNLALSTGKVECYKPAILPPIMENISARLSELADLQANGKLTSQAITQAHQAISAEINKERSAGVGEEATEFLLQLLGF